MKRNSIFIALLWLCAAQAQTPVSITANSWAAGAPMPTARQYPFAGAIGSNIYVVGGANQGNLYNVNEVYNSATNTWTTAAPMPTARWNGAAAVVNNILYAIGGGSSNTLSVVEAYDPSTNSWSTKSPMPVATSSIFAAVENGIIYVAGGSNANGRLTTLLSYNPATDTWNTLAPMKVGKSEPALAVLGSTLISAGGLLGDNSTATTDTEGYNAVTNSWTTLAPMPTARQAGCFGTIGGLLYFTSGDGASANDILTSTVAYNPVANAWTTGLSPIPVGAGNPASAVVGGRLYCFGGSSTGQNGSNATIYNYVQIYQPAIPPPTITSGGVVPVFSTSTTIEPGSWVSIYGTNLSSATTTWNGDFPTSLGGSSVTINGKAAYLWFVSPGQINVQAPDDTATGAVVVVVNNGVSTASAAVTLAAYAPSFSLLSARYPAAIVATPGSPGNSGGGYDIIGPAGAFSFPTRPVKAGETVIIYGVGFGPTTTPVPAGKAFSGAASSPVLPTVTIGGVPATVTFSGIVEAGLFQLNLVVPGAGSGDQPLVASIGGVTTQNNVFITLQ